MRPLHDLLQCEVCASRLLKGKQIGSSVIENFEYGFQRLFLFRLSMDIPYQNSNFHNFAETRFRLISCVRVNEMPECDDK